MKIPPRGLAPSRAALASWKVFGVDFGAILGPEEEDGPDVVPGAEELAAAGVEGTDGLGED